MLALAVFEALVFLAFSGELSVSNIFLALFKIVNSGFFGSLPSLVGFKRFYCFISTWGFGSYLDSGFSDFGSELMGFGCS
jgi:hypothetical protein